MVPCLADAPFGGWLGRADVARRLWRRGPRCRLSGRLQRGGCATKRTVCPERRRHDACRPDDPRPRLGGSEGALPAADPLERGVLVPGLQRAWCRLRSRRPASGGPAGRRRLADKRREGLDLECASRAAVPAPRTDGFRRSKARRHHLLPCGHERDRRTAARDDQ